MRAVVLPRVDFTLERICILEDDQVIRLRHLPPRILREVEIGKRFLAAQGEETEVLPEQAAPAEAGFHAATSTFQHRLIAGALERAGGRLGRAAKEFGLSRHALRHQMAKLGMDRM